MGIDIAAERKEKARLKDRNEEENVISKAVVIECPTCKAGKMQATKINKFGIFARFTGYVIAIPSAVGALVGLVAFFSFIGATSETMATATNNAQKAGVAIGAGLGFGFALFTAVLSLGGGLVSWVLLMKKKVYKCLTCAFIIDRA